MPLLAAFEAFHLRAQRRILPFQVSDPLLQRLHEPDKLGRVEGFDPFLLAHAAHRSRFRLQPQPLINYAFWAEFDAAAPRLLGALLSAVSHALATVEQVQREITDLPRMADFALWAYAALGEQGSAFLDAYSSNRADAATEPLEGEPIAEPLQKVAETAWQAGGNWSGTASELLAELAARAGEPATKRLHWPASARALSGRLRRLAPALRAIGIEVLFDQRAHGGRRLLTLVKSAANDRHHRHHRHAESENCAEGDANAGQGDANEDRADGFASPTGQHAESAGDAGDGGDARSRGFSGAGQADDDADPLAERCRECDNAGGWLGQPGAWRCRACGARRMCWHCLGYQPPEHVPAIAEDVEGRGCCARHAATGEAAAADDGDGGAGG